MYKLLLIPSILAMISEASVPVKCIVATDEEFFGVTRGNEVEVNEDAALVADPTTRFFGVRSCVDKITGRMVSIQFFLRKDGVAELLEMPQVGPTLPDDLISCVRRKLENEEFHIN